MKVFFDNCTSPVLAEALNGYLSHLGDAATHIRDLECGRHASDIEWIGYLAASGAEWIVITGDRRIHKNRAERIAFRGARLGGFVLASGYQKTPIHHQVSALIWRWPEVRGLLKLAKPFLFELPLTRTGKIRSLPI